MTSLLSLSITEHGSMTNKAGNKEREAEGSGPFLLPSSHSRSMPLVFCSDQIS